MMIMIILICYPAVAWLCDSAATLAVHVVHEGFVIHGKEQVISLVLMSSGWYIWRMHPVLFKIASWNPRIKNRKPKHIHICPNQWHQQYSYHLHMVPLPWILASICPQITLHYTHQQTLTSASLDMSGINHCQASLLSIVALPVSIQPHISAVVSAGHITSSLSPPSQSWKLPFRVLLSSITCIILPRKWIHIGVISGFDLLTIYHSWPLSKCQNISIPPWTMQD